MGRSKIVPAPHQPRRVSMWSPPRLVEGGQAIRQVEVSQWCSLAVVALGSRPFPDSIGLEIIRSLKRKGFKVISYEEGAQSWSLGVRCQVLLAGSLWLLGQRQDGVC
jgi:hypothetical protein